MQIEIDSTRREPIYQQLANNILERIRSGALPPGTRLPTVRQLAQQLGVTRLTIHSAYAELQADGWIEATVGRGTFVSRQIDALKPPPESRLGQEVTPAGVLADILHVTQLPGLIALARSDPANDLFPLRHWQQASELALADGGAALMSYTTAQGDLPLRGTLAELLRERGLTTSPDEIVITSGVAQGLALATEILAHPGDTVLVEQPTFLGMLDVLAARGIRVVGVPIDAEGIVVEALATLLQTERPAFLYSIPAYQNPTGVCLSPTRRTALLNLAQQHSLMIVEDDIYARLGLIEAAPLPLKADDRTGQVIYLGGFSKSLMPGLRMGYALPPPHLVQRMVRARQSQDLCSSPLIQRALSVFIEQGWLHTHTRRVLPVYRERRDALLQAMQRFFPAGVTWTQPQGGFSCWVTLPYGLSATELYLHAIGRGVAFTPGDVFCAAPSEQSHLRLSYGAEPPERITEAVATLGALLREHAARLSCTNGALSAYVPLV